MRSHGHVTSAGRLPEILRGLSVLTIGVSLRPATSTVQSNPFKHDNLLINRFIKG